MKAFMSPFRFFLLMLVIIAGGMGLGWYLAGPEEILDIAVKRSGKWELPNWQVSSISHDIEILKEKKFFGEKKQDTPQPEEPSKIDLKQGWSALGIIVSGQTYSLLIKNDQTKEVQTLKQGDKFPDGGIVAKIEKDSFYVQSDKGQEEVRLFPFILSDDGQGIEEDEDQDEE